MVNKEQVKPGDILTGIPLADKGSTEEHNLEVLEIYQVTGKKKFRCFSLTGNLKYPGCADYGREIVLSEEDLVNLEKHD